MTDTNNVNIAGRIVKDAEFKQMGNSLNCRFSIAVNKSKKIDGAWEDEVSYIDIQAWGKLAETMVGNLKKGTRINVTGYLKQDRWEQEGQQRSKLQVVANDIFFEAPKESVNGF